MSQSHRLTNRTPRALAAGAAVLAALAVGVSAPLAGAASRTPGDFSSVFERNPTIYIGYVDDCIVELGPVFDSIPAPNYRKIGGVRVNCASVHAVIKATVWQQAAPPGGTWFNMGGSGVGTSYNQAGSGAGLNGILRSQPVCNPVKNRAYWWHTVALVQTERAARYFYSEDRLGRGRLLRGHNRPAQGHADRSQGGRSARPWRRPLRPA